VIGSIYEIADVIIRIFCDFQKGGTVDKYQHSRSKYKRVRTLSYISVSSHEQPASATLAKAERDKEMVLECMILIPKFLQKRKGLV
jgi:hypothetical protein